jgi:hypothetical protein
MSFIIGKGDCRPPAGDALLQALSVDAPDSIIYIFLLFSSWIFYDCDKKLLLLGDGEEEKTRSIQSH